jgi:hypothetical protein
MFASISLTCHSSFVSAWRRFIGNIKREVSAEDIGWLFGGGLAARQLKAATVLFPPALAVILFLDDGLLKQILLGTLIGAWFLNGVALYAIGTVFLGKKMDRYYDRKEVRPKLPKDYRER